MDKEKPEFPIGYKKPPRHTRFKPGQSGNPGGRPKSKPRTFAESVVGELNTWITVNEGGKQRRIRKLELITKQQTNKAIQGDHKATALVMKAVDPRESHQVDNLPPLLQALRAIHSKHEIADQNGTRATGASGLTADGANNTNGVNDDED